MPAFPKSPAAGSLAGLAMLAALTLSVNASAQTSHRPIHHRTHVAAQRHFLAESPLAPGVELRASTYANPGSENHYYSDTVAAGHADLQDIRYRYGQSPSTQYNSAEPLFRF
jgi:hypothetical protein